MTRPSVAVPTGIEIGAPVSMACMPRCMPSVGFIATVRTRFSPRCCSTSQMTSIASPRVGRPRSDDPHGVVDRRQVAARELDVDDGPMTWTTLPTFCSVAAAMLLMPSVCIQLLQLPRLQRASRRAQSQPCFEPRSQLEPALKLTRLRSTAPARPTRLR